MAAVGSENDLVAREHLDHLPSRASTVENTRCPLLPHIMLFPKDLFIWRYHDQPAQQRRSWALERTAEGLTPRYIYHIYPSKEPEAQHRIHHLHPYPPQGPFHHASTSELDRDRSRRSDTPSPTRFPRIPIKLLSGPRLESAGHAPASSSTTSPSCDSSPSSSPAATTLGSLSLDRYPSGSIVQGPLDDAEGCTPSLEAFVDAAAPPAQGRKPRRRANELPRDFATRRHRCDICGKLFAR